MDSTQSINKTRQDERLEYLSRTYSDLRKPEPSNRSGANSLEPLQSPLGHDGELPLNHAIRLHWKLVLYTLGLMCSLFIHGYDSVINGSITGRDSFLQDYGEQTAEGEWISPAVWMALWNAMPGVGSVVGTIIAGYLQDWVGRRWCLCVGGLLSLCGVTLLFTSNMHPDKESMRVALLLGQIVEGLAVGITDTQAMTYASETIPTSLRGPAMALNPAFLFLGQLVGAAIMIATGDLPGEWSYRVALASQWPLSLLIFVFAFVIPESPAYLIRKGNYDKAHRSVSQLFTPQANPDVIYRRMRLAIEQESVNKSNASYKDCFVGVDFRRTMVVIVTNLYTGAAGLPLLSSASYFLRRLGMDEEPAFMILLIGIAVAFLCNVVGLWLLPKFGRRQLILIGFPIICVMWTAVGISGFWRTTPIASFTAVVFVAIAAILGLLIWPAGYAISGEASSLRLRSKTQGIGGFANNGLTMILNLVLPYAYNDDQGDLGGITALIHTFLTALMFVATWFIVPELKGRDVKEIGDMFELKLPTRAFKSWDGNLGRELESIDRSS